MTNQLLAEIAVLKDLLKSRDEEINRLKTRLCYIPEEQQTVNLKINESGRLELADTNSEHRHTNVSTYQWEQMVRRLAKPGEDIIKTLGPSEVDLLHAAIGISGEAGELLDAVKKCVIYNKPLNWENIIEELGDIEFYLEQLRGNQLILTTRHRTLGANYEKLSKRYSSGTYSDTQAQKRADKKII